MAEGLIQILEDPYSLYRQVAIRFANMQRSYSTVLHSGSFFKVNHLTPASSQAATDIGANGTHAKTQEFHAPGIIHFSQAARFFDTRAEIQHRSSNACLPVELPAIAAFHPQLQLRAIPAQYRVYRQTGHFAA